MGAGHQMPIKCQMFPMYLNIQFFSHFNQTVNGSGWLSPPDIPDLYFDLSFPVVVYCCLLLSPVAYCCLLLPTVVYCCLLLSNVRTFSTPYAQERKVSSFLCPPQCQLRRNQWLLPQSMSNAPLAKTYDVDPCHCCDTKWRANYCAIWFIQ